MSAVNWSVTRSELRVHPTAKLEVREFLPDRPGMEWRWEVLGDTAVKWGYATSQEKAKEDALEWWNKFMVVAETHALKEA